MIVADLRVGEVVSLRLPQDGSRELACVVAVSQQDTTVELKLRSQDDTVKINWSIPGEARCVEDVTVTAPILAAMGFTLNCGWLYGLGPTEEFWEKTFTLAGIPLRLEVKQERNRWVAVEENTNAFFGCRFVDVNELRQLQRYFRTKYHRDFPDKVITRLFE